MTQPGYTRSPDGVAIHYQVHGPGTPALVFVHGWSCNQSHWKEQVSYFSQRYTVVTIDLAGHGNSGRNRDDWTMAAFGEDITAVVAELGLDQVILLGHSMGGPVIVEAAHRMPDRIIGLVSVDGFGFDLERTPEEVENELQPLIEDFAGTMQAVGKDEWFVATSDASLVTQIVTDAAAAPPEVAIPAVRNFLLWKASEGLPRVQAPMKQINSDRGEIDMEAAERYGVDVLLMSGVGHFVMMEDPDTFNRLLSAVIAEFTAPSAG
jgi:pimeloyl-ACP methyl ester carboxylesterase